MTHTPWIRSMSLPRAALLLLAFLLTCLLAVPAQAQTAPTAAPGAGFADPAAVPRRAPPADIEPVLRGPSVDMLATIRKRGVLRVGVAANVPMVMHDTQGKLVGFSIDLARRLADDLGVQLELVETSWAAVLPDLLGKQFDLIASGLWVTTSRALVVNFSQPTASLGIHLVAGKTGTAGLASSADFNRPGVTIAVYANTTQASVATRLFPKANVVQLEGNSDPIARVLSGQAQAALVPSISTRPLLRNAGGKLFLPRDAQLATSRAALAVRKGDPDFLNYLNTWLSVQQDEGWLEERAVFWSGNTDWMK